MGELKTLGKAIGYPILGLALAPFAWAIYVSYRATAWTFKHPKLTTGILAGAGLLWYAEGHDWQGKLEQTVISGIERSHHHKTKPLEDRLQKNAQLVPIPLAQPDVITDPVFNFYYVHPGDTLMGISKMVSGTPQYHNTISLDNKLGGKDILAGQLIKLRKDICILRASHVYSQIPKLKSSVVPGSTSITDFFYGDKAKASETISINRDLGLMYSDTYPDPNAQRIVYYR